MNVFPVLRLKCFEKYFSLIPKRVATSRSEMSSRALLATNSMISEACFV